MEDEEEDQDDEWDLDCLTVRLSKKDKQRIWKLWKQTLIVKLLGRSIGYHHLLKMIKELWRPKAKLELVAMDNGFFLVNFASNEDYDYTLYGGP